MVLFIKKYFINFTYLRWSEISHDFLKFFNKFIIYKKSLKRFTLSPNSNKNGENNIFGLTVILSCCSPSSFYPIDQFYECIRTLFEQFNLSNEFILDIFLFIYFF